MACIWNDGEILRFHECLCQKTLIVLYHIAIPHIHDDRANPTNNSIFILIHGSKKCYASVERFLILEQKKTYLRPKEYAQHHTGNHKRQLIINHCTLVELPVINNHHFWRLRGEHLQLNVFEVPNNEAFSSMLAKTSWYNWLRQEKTLDKIYRWSFNMG
jgi:hypothetical protein